MNKSDTAGNGITPSTPSYFSSLEYYFGKQMLGIDVMYHQCYSICESEKSFFLNENIEYVLCTCKISNSMTNFKYYATIPLQLQLAHKDEIKCLVCKNYIVHM
jgi:hypothetical protein